ncbi:MAG TPA: nucleotide exchange factor GrpE [Azospirillum sp.]
MSDPINNNKPADAEGQVITDSGTDSTEPDTGTADERVAKLEAEVAGLKDQLLRAMAEAENTRRRAQRDREDATKFAVSGFAKDLVGVADNLRRALEAVPPEGREKDEMLKSLAVGVEATERQLLAAFERAGIKKLEPVGEPFDPNFHQVMFEIENTGKPAGTVVQVLQNGYVIHGRLLREAMVGVAKRGPEDNGQQVDTKA